MASTFDGLPPSFAGKTTPSRFHVSVPDTKLAELQKLVRLSPLAPATYENQQSNRRYGVSREWMAEAKARWEKFDWFVLNLGYVETFLSELFVDSAGAGARSTSIPSRSS